MEAASTIVPTLLKSGKKRHVVESERLAHAEIYHAKHNQYGPGDNCAHKAAISAEHVGRPLATERVKRRKPIHEQRYHQCVHLVRRKSLVETFRPEHICQRRGCKHKHRRKPYHHCLPFEKHGKPAPPRAKRFGNPAVKSAAFGPGRRQLGAYQREGQQKNNRRKQIIKNRLHPIFSFRRQSAETQYGSDNQDSHRHHGY